MSIDLVREADRDRGRETLTRSRSSWIPLSHTSAPHWSSACFQVHAVHVCLCSCMHAFSLVHFLCCVSPHTIKKDKNKCVHMCVCMFADPVQSWKTIHPLLKLWLLSIINSSLLANSHFMHITWAWLFFPAIFHLIMHMLYEQCVNVYMHDCEHKWVLKGHNKVYYITAAM